MTADLRCDLITLAHRRTHTAIALGALDYWMERCYGRGGPVKSSFDCPARGYWGRGVTLSLPSEPRWRGSAEQSMHIVLDRALGPTGSFDRHLSNKAITDHTQCEPLPHVLRNFT